MNKEFIDKWISQLKKGSLSFVILGVLAYEQEYYGYDLIQEVKKKTTIDIAEGTLYPLLIRLKNEGLVESQWVPQKTGIPRKYYKITKEGQSTFLEMRSYWAGLNQHLTTLTHAL
ncbi:MULTISPECIES: PadR family transcriptional regulator [unclassified Sphingobacterium]|uniref:PadR family transcriptional regulator n=1 Tax=unclassified Sphingobacterium TaxID=2609468 RepID=UPI0025F44248|nr:MULTISPECIES: PadR family transcriptional regulator [unclassified Sphingobacterium]